MPFFENAKQFNISGGQFIDLKGNQNNYHYDQSLKVDGQGNSATYTHGSHYNGGDNRSFNEAGNMTVMGQGPNAGVSLNTNSMPFNYSQSQPSFPPYFNQSYGHLQANAPPPAQPHGYGPPNGMFSHSTGHLNPNPPYSPVASPQQPPHHYPNSFPSSPQPVGHQYPGPAQPQHFPAHHSQTSINSAPANVNVQPIQVIQTNHQRAGSHTSGSLSPNIVPQQQPPSQPPQQPRVDNQTAPVSNGFLGAPVMQSSPSVSSSTGSVLSGTTLAQSPQPMVVDPLSALPSPTVTASSAAGTTATEASTSSTSSPVVQGQPEQYPLSEFPDMSLIPGATIPDASQEDEEKKKKKKKGKFFSKWFKKTPKETASAVNT